MVPRQHPGVTGFNQVRLKYSSNVRVASILPQIVHLNKFSASLKSQVACNDGGVENRIGKHVPENDKKNQM